MARKKSRSDGLETDITLEPGPVLPVEGLPAPTDSPASVPFVLANTTPSDEDSSAQASSPAASHILLEPLEERLQRLEQAITQLERTRRESAPALGPVVMGTAHALVEASRQLFPTLRADAGGRPANAGWFAFLRDIFAELQAIYYMYVDPRYRLSWLGRVVPPMLLLLILTSSWWLSFFACGAGLLFQKPMDLCLSYALFKIVTMEARQYRQTAPDLPPSLRL